LVAGFIYKRGSLIVWKLTISVRNVRRSETFDSRLGLLKTKKGPNIDTAPRCLNNRIHPAKGLL